MARPYAAEMSNLSETFGWAALVNIDPLRLALRAASYSSLLAIGSGGSLTAAHAVAGMHQRWTGRLAAVATPLDAVAGPLDPNVAVCLLSAGGSNVDIMAAARALIGREPRQLIVVCGREDSPLAQLCRDHPFVDLLLYAPPAGKDGFLATNSLLAFTALLARAYAIEFEGEAAWQEAARAVGVLLEGESSEVVTWNRLTMPLWNRLTTLVLHGPSTRIGAIDLESKFTEAALGTLQIADFRNFAHGRHHWLAKRGEITAVLALISEDDRPLAERTLALIPQEIPRAALHLEGSPLAATLASLVAALRITGWAGIVRGIDPGRPGVPEFGRKLYNLPLPRAVRRPTSTGLTDREAVAIARKARVSIDKLHSLGELERWRQALLVFRGRLESAAFAAMVLDYDGTVVDTKRRFEPACEDMACQLMRVVESGARLAIATGRGASVRRDLRARLPESFWNQVLVGYYNGAQVAWLDDDDAPDGSDMVCESLLPLAAALRAQPELADAALQTDRRFQITLEPKRFMPESRLWDIAQQALLVTGCAGGTIMRSSHSLDIVAEGVSKLNVMKRVRERIGAAPVLTIGDRGCWPGNDCELLREEFALSVDEVSADPATCWNLAPRGQRGVAATLAHLQGLASQNGALRFGRGALK